jgi:curved DNA-binding protein CbpA
LNKDLWAFINLITIGIAFASIQRSKHLRLQDYYFILNVSPDADSETIEKQYWSLSKAFHPDKCADDPEANKVRLEIEKAREVLLDPEQRRKYDQTRKGFQEGKTWKPKESYDHARAKVEACAESWAKAKARAKGKAEREAKAHAEAKAREKAANRAWEEKEKARAKAKARVEANDLSLYLLIQCVTFVILLLGLSHWILVWWQSLFS